MHPAFSLLRSESTNVSLGQQASGTAPLLMQELTDGRWWAIRLRTVGSGLRVPREQAIYLANKTTVDTEILPLTASPDISHQTAISEGGTYRFIGQGHGSHAPDGAPTYTMDGSPVSLPAVGSFENGSELIATINGTLTHPDIDAGATTIATTTQTFTVNQDGITESHTINWNLPQQLFCRACYDGMQDTSDAFTRWYGVPDRIITWSTSISPSFWSDSQVVIGWIPASGITLGVYVDDIAAMMGAIIPGDREPFLFTANARPKQYFPRSTIVTPLTLPTGVTVWSGSKQMRLAVLADPEAELIAAQARLRIGTRGNRLATQIGSSDGNEIALVTGSRATP